MTIRQGEGIIGDGLGRLAGGCAEQPVAVAVSGALLDGGTWPIGEMVERGRAPAIGRRLPSDSVHRDGLDGDGRVRNGACRCQYSPRLSSHQLSRVN